eukprot:gene27605-29510_t
MCCGGNDDDTSNGYVETCSSMDEACSAEDLNLNEWKYYAECEGSNGCDTSIGSNDWKMCCDATKCNSLKKACGDNGLAFNERSFDVECEDTAAGCNATVGSNDFNTCCEVPRCERFTLTKSCDTEAGHQPNQLTKFDTCSSLPDCNFKYLSDDFNLCCWQATCGNTAAPARDGSTLPYACDVGYKYNPAAAAGVELSNEACCAWDPVTTAEPGQESGRFTLVFPGFLGSGFYDHGLQFQSLAEESASKADAYLIRAVEDAVQTVFGASASAKGRRSASVKGDLAIPIISITVHYFTSE